MPRGRGQQRRGVTLIELVVVLTFVAILTGLALPAIGQFRNRSALQNSRHLVTSSLSLTAATGVRWGRTSLLRIDTLRDVLRVVVDTGAAGSGVDTLVVREFDLGSDLGVDISSNRATLCFNSRGVGTAGVECPATGGWISLRYAGTVDTVRVNPAGRPVR